MHYFILALSKGRAQLYEVTDGRILPRGADGMPVSVDDAWKGMERQEKSVQFYGGGPGAPGGSPVFHGMSDAKQVAEQEENEYVHAVAKAVHGIVRNQPDPLVFAGVTEMYGMFKKYDTSGRLIDGYLRGNHDRTPPGELLSLADPLVQQAFSR